MTTNGYDPAFLHEVSSSTCPQCMKAGGVFLNAMTCLFACNLCKAQNIDPFAIGPWEKTEKTLDTMDGTVVSSFLVKGEKSIPDENQNMLDFWKYIVEKGEVVP